MAKEFKRSMLLCINKYSLYNALLGVLDSISDETRGFDVRTRIPHRLLRIHAQMFRFPNRVRSRWEGYFLNRVNQELIREVDIYDPGLVMVYNSEFLLPETCLYIRKKAKLVFFMGDSPFYTPINNFYLASLACGDLILAPDTFWQQQLHTIGLRQTRFFMTGIDYSSYHILENDPGLESIPENDLIYTGMCYADSWGYKKALLMSRFTGFRFRLYGNKMWKRWFRFFPDLESHYTESGYIPTADLNRMFNRTRLIPVDGNPGILNGFHLRLFEALGAGALPLIEYRYDVANTLFRGFGKDLPIITDYSRAKDLAGHYLSNEAERIGLVAGMRSFLDLEYSSRLNGERLVSYLKEKH